MGKKIFLLEDDAALIDGLLYSLKKESYDVTAAKTVCEALTILSKEKFDILLLDVTLPDGTGFEVCGSVRKSDKDVPIIFLTAADEEINVIRGLDCGADDYITKPFRLGELYSRIRAQLRRSSADGRKSETVYESRSLKIDFISNEVTFEGRKLELTAAEYRLICLLIKNEGKTVTRRTLFDELWDGNGNFVDDNTLSVYIRRLREKIEDDPSHPKRLVTVRGFGYMWKEDK
jgi:DNA-binding response OmpR family regulator